ncbi:MAG TPA: hypothetical protein VMU99_09990 [Acidimicrobiales bacterium]|nr:hypothetical protein [Acidimicrobiales bacterium]
MTQTLDGIIFGASLRLEPYPDPVVESLGHDPRSTYVERFWLPVLGPSTTLLLRLFVDRLEGSPKGVDVDVAESARALGLGERRGRHGPFLRSVARAIDFDMVRYLRPGAIGVRRSLPSLSSRNIARLPDSLQREHAQVIRQAGATTDLMVRRGRQLALSLLALGESTGDTQRQLTRWSFDERFAHECTRWAARELDDHNGHISQATTHLARLEGRRTSVGS